MHQIIALLFLLNGTHGFGRYNLMIGVDNGQVIHWDYAPMPSLEVCRNVGEALARETQGKVQLYCEPAMYIS